MTIRMRNVQTDELGTGSGDAPVFVSNPVLPSLTARQFKLGLVRNGITLTSIEALLSGESDPVAREDNTIEWTYSSTFERDHPLVISLSASLGLSAEQVDAMWEAALTY